MFSIYQYLGFVRDKPLALYLFSEKSEDVNRFLENTTSGGVCVNDTMMHVLGIVSDKQFFPHFNTHDSNCLARNKKNFPSHTFKVKLHNKIK